MVVPKGLPMNNLKSKVQHIINTTCDVVANIYCLSPYSSTLSDCLSTINTDDDKRDEFVRLTGFSPDVVIQLMPHCPGLSILDVKINRFKNGIEHPAKSIVVVPQ